MMIDGVLQLNKKSADEFCRLRMKLFTELSEIVKNQDVSKLKSTTRQYYLSHINKDFSLLEVFQKGTLVAVEGDFIVGFGDVDPTGYLDRIFVHKDFQGNGIATAICNQLEQVIQGHIVTHASITARPFFEKRGYTVVKEQQVERQGIFLTNFIMIKKR